ncbi:MAG TPA: hypothetical protein VGC41_04375 [Kofleriaceae bacterium]
MKSPPQGGSLPKVTAALGFVVLLALASGSPGWAASSSHAILAVRLAHSAGAPLYDLFASVAALVPFGEPAFRLQLLGAVLGAMTLAGVVAAGRALLPKEASAGVAAAVLLVLAPPFREALGTPEMLAACGVIWAIAWLRGGDHVRALAACALVVGSAPWLGLALVLAVMAFATAKPKGARRIAIAVAAIGAMVVLLWFDAAGTWPELRVDLATAVSTSGRGAVVVGVGLLGIAFGAATGLPFAPKLAVIAALVAVHAILVGGSAILLATFSLGIAIVVAAIARMLLPRTESSEQPVGAGLAGWKRDAVVALCGAPLLVAGLATGFSTDDPGATPRLVVHDLVDQIPTGPGIFVATRSTGWIAISYERAIAGLRPDLQMGSSKSDVRVAEALRAHRIVGSDAAGFGRLDLSFAQPRGRGFQLLGAVAPPAPVSPPADYASALGRDEALALALERAEAEASSGRLDGAARALALEHRFGAADLALLAATNPTHDRPPLFGFLPPIPRGQWIFDTFGDDLAWMANIPLADPPATAPYPRRLLALWRKILTGSAKPEDAAPFGSDAVAATAELMKELGPKPPG